MTQKYLLIIGLITTIWLTVALSPSVQAQDDDPWNGCTGGDNNATYYLAQHYQETYGFNLTIYPYNPPETMRYHIDFGDGASQVYTLNEVTTGITHIWPAFGDYTITYRVVDTNDCRGPRRYAYVPVHAYHIAGRLARANADGTIETTTYVAGTDGPTINLTNGQSSKLTAWIADENETPYERGRNGLVTDFRWRYNCFTYPAQDCAPDENNRVAPNPRGKILLTRDDPTEQSLYYLPAWEEETAQAFGVSLDHNQITYRGQNVHIMPRGFGANYRVTRPKLAISTTAWTSGDAILTNYQPVDQQLTIQNTPDYSSEAINSGMTVTWSVSTGAPWLTVGDISSATISARDSATATVSINPAGLQPGIYSNFVELTTPNIAWPAADPWGNTFDAPVFTQLAQALNSPLRLPVAIIVAEPDTTPLIPPTVPEPTAAPTPTPTPSPTPTNPPTPTPTPPTPTPTGGNGSTTTVIEFDAALQQNPPPGFRYIIQPSFKEGA